MSDNKTIKFEIATPEKVVLQRRITQIVVPTEAGEITVLFGHIPLVSNLIPGIIEIKDDKGETEVISVSGGFIEVLKDKIVILADTAERAEEIDEERIEEARKKADEIKKGIRKFDEHRFTNINARIATELARSKAIKRWKKIKNIK